MDDYVYLSEYTQISSNGISDCNYEPDDYDGKTTIQVDHFQIPSLGYGPQDSFSDLLNPIMPATSSSTVMSADSQSHIDDHQTLSPQSLHRHLQTPAPTVPSNTPYVGAYGFAVSFGSQSQVKRRSKDTKSIPWTYSESLHRLFVGMATTCPIRFKTALHPPPGSVIRAMAIYTKPEHVQEVVKRCPNHLTTKELNKYHMEPAHFIRSEHKLAQHVEDPYTLRQSVIIPHEAPQAGAEWVVNLYQFMCYNSCVGSLNRRPIQVIFSLEYDNEVLGRQPVDVRVCACPGRDRELKELKEVPSSGQIENKQLKEVPSSGHKPQNKRNKMSAVHAELTSIKPVAKKRKIGDDEFYTIKVRGRLNYEFLSRIRDCMELASMIPQNQQDLYKRQQAELQKQTQSEPGINQELPPSPPPTPTFPSTPRGVVDPRQDSNKVIIQYPVATLPAMLPTSVAVDVEYLPQFEDIDVDRKPWLDSEDLSSVALDAFFQPLASPVLNMN